MTLTISMATYDDYDGVYFACNSIRLHHKLPPNTEFLILDNNPESDHGRQIKHLAKSIPEMRVVDVVDRTSSFVKYDAFHLAKGDVILGLDCHVLLAPGFIENLMEYWSWNPNSKNMVSGPLLYDNMVSTSDLMRPVWNGHDFGVWGDDKEAVAKGDPYEVPMQGMGCFSFIRKNAPKISDKFSGFGGEEWYMAEKTRQNGGVVVCLPQLKWNHRFDWPKRTFPLVLHDKIVNYYVAFLDLYGDLMHPACVEMTQYWNAQVPTEDLGNAIREAMTRLGLPFVG